MSEDKQREAVIAATKYSIGDDDDSEHRNENLITNGSVDNPPATPTATSSTEVAVAEEISFVGYSQQSGRFLTTNPMKSPKDIVQDLVQKRKSEGASGGEANMKAAMLENLASRGASSLFVRMGANSHVVSKDGKLTGNAAVASSSSSSSPDLGVSVETDAAVVTPALKPAEITPSAPAVEVEVKLKDDPKYSKYIKMFKVIRLCFLDCC
jgi:hypothetical protein